jgi:hypothetical protein
MRHRGNSEQNLREVKISALELIVKLGIHEEN